MPGDDDEATSRRRRCEHELTARHRAPAARLHRRPGRRRPRQRRARDRGHDPQHRARSTPPPTARCASSPSSTASRSSRPSRSCGYMHRGYEKLDRGPHLPAGHHAHQPHRLAGQLRQRGAVHPRRREAHGASRPRPGRSGSARSSSRCPASPTSRCSSATSASQLGGAHRRCSTPSATASSCSTRSRPSPAGASTRTSTASAA